MSNLFHVSAKDHGALILMSTLAERYASGEYVRVQDVAEDMKLSQGYLEETAACLKEAGLIAGRQGPGGGYRLAKPPASISMSDILTALEGPLALVDCQAGSCPVEGKCISKSVWGKLQKTIHASLEGMSLAEVIN